MKVNRTLPSFRGRLTMFGNTCNWNINTALVSSFWWMKFSCFSCRMTKTLCMSLSTPRVWDASSSLAQRPTRTTRTISSGVSWSILCFIVFASNFPLAFFLSNIHLCKYFIFYPPYSPVAFTLVYIPIWSGDNDDNTDKSNTNINHT